MSESKDWKSKVDQVMTEISNREKVNRATTRRLLHRYVCEGKCQWYRSYGDSTGFDSLKITQRVREIEKVIEKIFEIPLGEARTPIHQVLCPRESKDK